MIHSLAGDGTGLKILQGLILVSFFLLCHQDDFREMDFIVARIVLSYRIINPGSELGV